MHLISHKFPSIKDIMFIITAINKLKLQFTMPQEQQTQGWN